jgi:hypothetical protein
MVLDAAIFFLMKFWPIFLAVGLVASRLLRLILLGVVVLGLELALVGGDVFLLLFGGDTFLLFLDLVVAGGELFLLSFLEFLLVLSAVALLKEVLEVVLLLAFVEGFASGLVFELFLDAALVGDSISDRFRFFVEGGGDSILIGD